MGRLALEVLLAAILVCLLIPAPAQAWGPNGYRLITNKAVETLPYDLRGFFEAHRVWIAQHSNDPLEWLNKNPAERRNQFIYLDRYGRFPFPDLPRGYNFALRKYGRAKLEANGLLPWQIGVYSERLTNAFRARNWDEVRQNAAILAYYVAAAHDPFNTTDNFDGRASGNLGIEQRFSVSLVDRYSLFFFLRPNDAMFINDPTDYAFEICLSSHSWLENIILADMRARRGLPDYTDEFYDRFYNQSGAILVRQLSDASSAVGSYWFTAWSNAGRPPLPAR
jgi:hypothetical protein